MRYMTYGTIRAKLRSMPGGIAVLIKVNRGGSDPWFPCCAPFFEYLPTAEESREADALLDAIERTLEAPGS